MGKKLGQVFLNNTNIAKQIVEALEPCNTDTIIEIGPGRGILTELFAISNYKLIGIELDNFFYNYLTKKFLNNNNISFINVDILEVSLSQILGNVQKEQVKIIGNIPYYITSPILNFLVLNKKFYKNAVIMMQYEVGERILASPDSREFGSLTLYMQYNMVIEKVLKVSRKDFYPQPKVDSIVLKFYPREEPKVKVHDEALLFNIINIAFQKRRKMLHNSLAPIASLGKNIIAKEILEKAEIDASLRPEDLSLENYATICNIVYQQMQGEG